MVEIISYERECDDVEKKLNELNKEARFCLELLEAYEELHGQCDEDELQEEIERVKSDYARIEHEMCKLNFPSMY